ncbi:MAG: hypothetical protein FWD33_03225 [Alphaproteobacteria bacterium]|nr:hypothetical protein [Alphaproteobacteria bacterium]
MGTPVLTGVKISGDEARVGFNVENSPSLSIVLNDCILEDVEFYTNISIQANNCSIKRIYVEGSKLALSGENLNVTRLNINEGSLKLDLKNSNIIGTVQLYKVHVSGSMKGGKFEFKNGDRTYLGQRNALIMEDVDFGKKDYDPDYFTHENMTLVSPKMNPSVLAKVKNIRPESVKDSAMSQKDKDAAYSKAADRVKAELLDTGKKFFTNTGKPAAEAERLAGEIYDKLAKKGSVDMENYSTALLERLMGKEFGL